ncbi:MvdC/MvdD family ATP grasp protein [Salinactinospora qingdaonensis]|uniref:ATP-grasp ribosomal peptide maturase n=1 Tax=Salinactinospora qingdaonensis TaxID=702744 RepID=A0ABP7F5F9_9ACTN
MSETTLLLAPLDDGEAMRGGQVLKARNRSVAWLDTAWFPTQVSVDAELGLDGWHGRIVTPAATIDLASIGAVYYRQPSPFELPVMSEPERRFAVAEARFGIGGILASLPVRWAPASPGRAADAEYKPLELAAAARAGMSVPATWLGNAPQPAAAFIDHQPNGAVSKALIHKVVSEQGQVKLLYTSTVASADIDARVATTMHHFQQRITAARDVRALATATGCEAVEITTRDSSRPLDYRACYDRLHYARTTLAADVIHRLQRLLAALGLSMGVVDLAVGQEGTTWYYEINPGGRWAWLEEETGAPVAALVADIYASEMGDDRSRTAVAPPGPRARRAHRCGPHALA